LIIYNAHKDDDNSWDFDLKLTDEEVNYLVHMSIQGLLEAGVISLSEVDGEQHIPLPTREGDPNPNLN
jgi:hypothetical protein